MAEYIEREALIEDIAETVVFTVREGVKLPTSEMRGANKVIDRIKSAPNADVVEVRHGEWQSLDRDHFSCTQCGHIFALGSTATIYNVKQQWQFCPKCGAKMK